MHLFAAEVRPAILHVVVSFSSAARIAPDSLRIHEKSLSLVHRRLT